jgi:hypothetical protein
MIAEDGEGKAASPRGKNEQVVLLLVCIPRMALGRLTSS